MCEKVEIPEWMARELLEYVRGYGPGVKWEDELFDEIQESRLIRDGHLDKDWQKNCEKASPLDG